MLDDMILRNIGSEANILVTQPRRISAIGVSERIASERCEKLGHTCGYSIRLDSKRSDKTRLLLCTTGVLLRRLQCDPDLASVSHVFVDEGMELSQQCIYAESHLIIYHSPRERSEHGFPSHYPQRLTRAEAEPEARANVRDTERRSKCPRF